MKKNETITQLIKEEIKQAIGSISSKYTQSEVDLTNLNIIVEKTKNIKFGDFSTNIALTLKQKVLTKIDLAKLIINQIKSNKFKKIEISNPGFINFFLTNKALNSELNKIIKKQHKYGQFKDKKLWYNIEYVSANPTGFLHIGHARNAAVGDTIQRLWKKFGIKVDTEYYINDGGNQIEKLGLSTLIRYLQLYNKKISLPEDSYHGEEIIDIAKILKNKYEIKFLETKFDDKKIIDVENGEIIKDEAKNYLLNIIKKDLNELNVSHDIWFGESFVYKNNLIKNTINKLKEHTYSIDDALWLKTTQLGDDKDRVLVKSDGSLTYFVPDIAYHNIKFSRGYDKLVNVWGADHKSYADRMKIAISLLGYDSKKLEILIMQMVKLIKDGKEFKMSKRSGNSLTMHDLVSTIGKDASRWYLIAQSIDSHLEIDVDKATDKNSDNGVYYVFYAYVRINQLLKKAKFKKNTKCNLLTLDIERELLNQLLFFKVTIENISESLEVHKLPLYLINLSKLFHSYYSTIKIISNDIKLSSQRLTLCLAISIVIKNGLDLIGIDVVDKM